jgi:hypothetical protein
MIEENVGSISIQPVYIVNPKKKSGSTLSHDVNNTTEAITGVQAVRSLP